MAIPVGLQLYSVRNALQADAVGTMAEVAAQGYRLLEMFGNRVATDLPLATLKAKLDALNTCLLSAHINPDPEDDLPKIVDHYAALGARYVVIPMAFYADAAAAYAMAERLNRFGRVARAAGLKLCYHNHFHEFQRIEGERTVLEILLAETDPALLSLELDTYWALRGGQDPVAFLRHHADRIELLHQKDIPAKTKGPVDLVSTFGPGQVIDMQAFGAMFAPTDVVEVGTGVMPIQAIIDEANRIGHIAGIIIEQDFTVFSEMESVALSLRNMNRYQGLAW